MHHGLIRHYTVRSIEVEGVEDKEHIFVETSPNNSGRIYSINEHGWFIEVRSWHRRGIPFTKKYHLGTIDWVNDKTEVVTLRVCEESLYDMLKMYGAFGLAIISQKWTFNVTSKLVAKGLMTQSRDLISHNR